jgi:hypothetical protein
MDSDAASRIFRSIVYGREADRSAAIAALSNPADPVDRTRLRLLILDALKREFYPGREQNVSPLYGLDPGCSIPWDSLQHDAEAASVVAPPGSQV